jgi:cysteine desulfurase
MIYLDNAATTACAPEVVKAMLPFFRDTFANAASIDHIPGNTARRAVDEAREAVAALVGAKPEDVIFTSGSTEANNLALSVSGPVLTTPIEHPSVLDPFAARKNSNDEILAVDRAGRIVISELRKRLLTTADALVSVIATNNEIGTEQDVEALAGTAHEAGAMLHLDATQAVGNRRIDMQQTRGLVGISISGHKIHGPKGVGALIASAPLRRRMSPVLRGGGHERGFRSGTLNVPGIVGFGVAARLVISQRVQRRDHLMVLRRRFLEVLGDALSERVLETVIDAPVSPHILSVRLRETNGRALLRAVRHTVAFSLGSACATNKSEPSHVLLALGLEKRAIAETIRISFSAEQSVEEVERAATILAKAAQDLSGYSISA